jgi:hypothetical protein
MWTKIKTDFENAGGVFTENKLGDISASPTLNGYQIKIDEQASISALKHEYQHFLDITEAELRTGAKITSMGPYAQNPKEWVRLELRAYLEEIKYVDSIGHQELSDKLFELYRAEKLRIYDIYHVKK